MAFVIGITGGIGAGKSVVSRSLRCRGLAVYDCDSEARRIMEGSESLKREIACRFGDGCIGPDGSLCRPAIAGVVFADDAHRLWLNSRVHALVRDDISRRVAEAGDGVFFVESAIMKSSGLDRMCDAIWLVEAPLELRVRRACRRDGSARGAVMARIRSQSAEFDGLDCPRVETIFNDGRSPLLAQIDGL